MKIVNTKVIAVFMLLLTITIHATTLEQRLSDPQTQKQAIKEMWEKGEQAVPELKEMLKANSKEIREIALVRIINFNNNRSFIEESKELLNKDTNLDLRKLAMQYFCIIKEKSAIEILQKKIKTAEEREKRYAIEAIAYIVNAEDKEYESVRNTLKEALNDNDGQVRMEAAYQLASKFEDEVGYAIAVQDISNKNPLTRERAVEVLGEIGKAESMGLIETALKDEEIWVRTKAKIAKEKLELVKEQSQVTSQKSGVKARKMSRKAMLADKSALKQKIEKLRAILNAEDKILDIKIWAANEMLDIGEEGAKAAEEMISKNEAGAYVMRKEKGNRR